MWEIFVIVGFVFLILEMLVPSMFFLNLSFAGFLTALISLYVQGFVYLILIFAVLAILSILLIPLITIDPSNPFLSYFGAPSPIIMVFAKL